MLRTIVLFLLGALSLQGQSRWNLQQCIDYAKTHNIGLRQANITNQINKNNATQTYANSLPSVNAGMSHVYNFGQTIDRFTNQFARGTVLSQNFYLSANLVLWAGFSQYNTIQSSHYTYLSGVEQSKQREYDLTINVANAYIGAIFAEELVKISKNQFDVTKAQLEQTLKLVTAGSAAKSVEYDIRAQLANEELNVTTAENNLQLSLLSLRQIMALDSIGNFGVEQPAIDVDANALISADVQQIYETALRSMPSIRSSDYAIQSAEKNLAAARGRVSPVLSLTGSMGTGTSGLAKDILGARVSGYDPVGFTSGGDTVYTPRIAYDTRTTPFSEQFQHNVNKSFGFTLNIPIFNGLQTHTAVKNAKLTAYNSKLSLDLVKQTLYQDIARAYADAKAALNKYHASNASMEAAAESFKYAQLKFSNGAISSIDFIASKNRLFAAESNLLQAKFDYIFKLKVLDFFQGKPLGF
jgi:outer membrane protein